MKKIILLPILLFAMASCKQENKKEFPQEALEAKMTSPDGTEYTFTQILEKYKGRVTVIDVWASWCPDCIKGMPKVHKLQEQFPDAAYVFLSYDKDTDSWKKGIDKYGAHGDNFHAGTNMKEGGFAKGINLDWIPRYMVVDKNSKIALFKAIEADDETLITTLKNLK